MTIWVYSSLEKVKTYTTHRLFWRILEALVNHDRCFVSITDKDSSKIRQLRKGKIYLRKATKITKAQTKI